MIKPAIPIDEEIRLLELKSFAISETTKEAVFDEIIWLASQIAQTPVAFISLIDFSRQWTKASIGLSHKESRRELSFCGHVVANKAPLITNNASLDPRFNDNPWVLENPKIQFYAGFPLQTATGQILGALCVADHEARALSENQIQSLEYLSHQVMREFQLGKTGEDLRQSGQNLQGSLRLIQQQQRELEDGARLGALGKLARGVAHEINNSLKIISGKSHLVLRSIQDGLFEKDQGERNVEGILNACDRIINFTKGLSKFSRNASGDSLEAVKIKDLVDEVLTLFEQKIKKMNVGFEKMGAVDLELECRPIEISQVLINLIGNAMEALHDSGDKQLKISWQKTSFGIELSVQDNGRRTANEYQSTFLGLHLSKEICLSHHGQIRVDARTDATLIIISLPVKQALKADAS